jgi:hypothetical protein
VLKPYSLLFVYHWAPSVRSTLVRLLNVTFDLGLGTYISRNRAGSPSTVERAITS